MHAKAFKKQPVGGVGSCCFLRLVWAELLWLHPWLMKGVEEWSISSDLWRSISEDVFNDQGLCRKHFKKWEHFPIIQESSYSSDGPILSFSKSGEVVERARAAEGALRCKCRGSFFRGSKSEAHRGPQLLVYFSSYQTRTKPEFLGTRYFWPVTIYETGSCLVFNDQQAISQSQGRGKGVEKAVARPTASFSQCCSKGLDALGLKKLWTTSVGVGRFTQGCP